MEVRKAFKYRIYPNVGQQQALALQFGHGRYVYNWGLALRKKCYQERGEGLNYYETAMRLLKLKQEILWLKEAHSQVLQQKLRDLDQAYKHFFVGRASYPGFKTEKGKQSIRYPQGFKFKSKRIYLPKVGWVRTVFHRALEGTAKNVTISKTKSGKYFASVQYEVEIEVPANENTAVGVDVGLKHFAVLSTGEKVEHPHYLCRSEKRLARLQRQHARKKPGGANREKSRMKIARLQEKIANQRSDFCRKLSQRLATEHSVIVLEDLHVRGMLKNRTLAKSISDSGWSMFGRQCEYKALWNGGEVRRTDRFFASSKRCSRCGWINQSLKLDHRTWTCGGCGVIHDRDENAAQNLVLQLPREPRKVTPVEMVLVASDLRVAALSYAKQEAQVL